MDAQTVLVKEAGRVSLSQHVRPRQTGNRGHRDARFSALRAGKGRPMPRPIFNGLVALDSHVYYGYAGLGALTLAEEKLDEASRWLTRAAELNPEDPTVHANLGEALLRQASVEEAAEEFQKALSLDPDGNRSGRQSCAGDPERHAERPADARCAG